MTEDSLYADRWHCCGLTSSLIGMFGFLVQADGLELPAPRAGKSASLRLGVSAALGFSISGFAAAAAAAAGAAGAAAAGAAGLQDAQQ